MYTCHLTRYLSNNSFSPVTAVRCAVGVAGGANDSSLSGDQEVLLMGEAKDEKEWKSLHDNNDYD